jgi:hypothetical protein
MVVSPRSLARGSSELGDHNILNTKRERVHSRRKIDSDNDSDGDVNPQITEKKRKGSRTEELVL